MQSSTQATSGQSKDIVVTYETLYELARLEKNRDDLQRLDEQFFSDVSRYLKDKISLLEQSPQKDSLFASDESETLTRQIVNAKKLVKDLFERREKKIISLAISRVKAGAAVVDTSNLLPEEHGFFNLAVELLQGNRKEVLDTILKGSVPLTASRVFAEQTNRHGDSLHAELKANSAEEPDVELDSDVPLMVRFTQGMDKFVGFDLEEYGPFQEGEMAQIPQNMAQLLSQQGKAEIIRAP